MKGLLVAATTLAFCAQALAQSAPPATARATIESVSADGETLSVRTRAGEQETVRLKPTTRVILVVPAALADIKPGSFVGVAALPGEGNELKAMEVHIFPEAMRGTGEGFRPFDLAPKSSMTNGNIAARVDAAAGPKLTVTYKGGEQTIVVDPKTPIVAFEPGGQERAQSRRGDHRQGAAARRRLDRGRFRPHRQGRARAPDVSGAPLDRAQREEQFARSSRPVLAVRDSDAMALRNGGA